MLPQGVGQGLYHGMCWLVALDLYCTQLLAHYQGWDIGDCLEP